MKTEGTRGSDRRQGWSECRRLLPPFGRGKAGRDAVLIEPPRSRTVGARPGIGGGSLPLSKTIELLGLGQIHKYSVRFYQELRRRPA